MRAGRREQRCFCVCVCVCVCGDKIEQCGNRGSSSSGGGGGNSNRGCVYVVVMR